MLLASLLAAAAATSNGDLASWYATRTLVDQLTEMQPEVVAKLLGQVEQKWKEMALADLRNKTKPGFAIESMKDSCSKVTRAIVAGSDGDKDRISTYLQDVCQRSSGDSAPMCESFSSVLSSHLSHDVYTNRQELDAGKFCADFYNGAVKDQVKKQAAALVAADKAAAEKAKADEKAKVAEEKEAAKAKARAEAEAMRTEANQLADQAEKELDQANSLVSKAKRSVSQEVKQIDAIGKEEKNAKDMAAQGRKEIELATEKEAEAAEKEAEEAQAKVKALRLKKAEEAQAATQASRKAEEAEKEAEEKKKAVVETVEKEKIAAKKEPATEKKTALIRKSTPVKTYRTAVLKKLDMRK